MRTQHTVIVALATAVACVFASATRAQTTQPLDGTPWNLSTGNLSVTYIQSSPIGAFPRQSFLEPPPSIESMKQLKQQGLINYEDYIAWGAVEREPGKWDWTQHDAVEKAVHAAGLKYVVYTWVHFPPAWLRDNQKQNRTLMKCLEHNEETNYLSIFDPKTIEHYDHFYKALSEHFGDKIDAVYACILGPYGEGNYPLLVPDWVNIGHCHEGFWCADDFARKAFSPMPDVSQIVHPHPDAFTTAESRKRWVKFVTWYHQTIIDFAEKSLDTTLKYFPKQKVRTKPGGNAGGVNPIAWGTYCPGYAKMATKFNDHRVKDRSNNESRATSGTQNPTTTKNSVLATDASPSGDHTRPWGSAREQWGTPYTGVTLQPADWHGAPFGDKWISTAYHFYGITLSTEPAGGLDHAGFVKRLYSDITCGSRQLFTYEYPEHAADIAKYVHLITGQPGETETAVFCPTTLYRFGGDLSPTIKRSEKLRDLTDFDVLDELLIADGALTPDRYKVLVMFQADYIDQPILDKLKNYLNAGGTILLAGSDPIQNLDGILWKPAGNLKYTAGSMTKRYTDFAASQKLKGYDGIADGVWTTRRGGQTVLLNTTDKPVTAAGVAVPAHEIAIAP
jgi:hypothetical protein